MNQKHHSNPTKVGVNDEWLTPPEIIKALGPFDLDPCSPIKRPWDTAKIHYTIEDDGFFLPWYDHRVFMNPPYGDAMTQWLHKLALHGNGIALTFARTDTKAFQNSVFQHASSIFFLKGRITFYNTAGLPGKFNGGAPSVLISYGKNNVEAIGDSGLQGKHLLINYTPVIFFGVDTTGTEERTWKTVISVSLQKLSGTASLPAIYEMVEQVAGDKVKNNQHYKAKIRQILQESFKRIQQGKYSLN